MKSEPECWLISNHLHYDNIKIQFIVSLLANHRGIIMLSLLSACLNNQCKNYWKFNCKWLSNEELQSATLNLIKCILSVFPD